MTNAEMIWTEMPDKSGDTMTPRSGTWSDLIERLRNVGTFANKSRCPWIKLATFGTKRSEKNSLRTNENLEAVYGIEGDYDKEQVTIEQARTMLESHGIRAAFYPSPSNRPGKPRWRVVAPLAMQHPPGARFALVARLNGALGGILAGESFTLSQGYFFGATPLNQYRVVTTFEGPNDGTCIDELDELDDIAIGKQGGNAPKDSGARKDTRVPKDSGAPEWDGGQRVDDAELIRQIVSTESFHDPLLTLTARYFKRGMPPEQIIATVRGFMEAANDGSDRWKSRMAEIPRLVKGAAEKFKPHDVDGLPFGSEQQLADELAKIAQGVLRWSPGFDWMRNMGTHWQRDDLLGRYTLAKQVCRAAAKDAGKLAPKICASSTTNAILSLARSAQGIVTAVAEWDANPMLLNTPGGVYDLSTGQEVSRDGLLFTHTTLVAPTATPTPIWDKFLQDVFDGDLEMVEFMQRVMGYCLTGSTVEQLMFFMFGSGANGKSVLLDVLRSIAGKYAHNLPSEALMTSRHERHPTTYAALHGKRLAISSEIEESAHWAESRIKSMTGDETMTARFMREDEFTFTISHKHLIAGNFKPRLKGDDPAVVRRMVLIPFTQTFSGIRRDNNLPEKLKAEYGGILAWCIEGAVKWSLAGLAIPRSVAAASEEYMAEHSDLDLWIAESCVVTPKASASAGELYTDFANWKRRNGEIAPSIKSFSQRLERKHRKTVTRRCAMFQGLRLNGFLEDGAGMPAAPSA